MLYVVLPYENATLRYRDAGERMDIMIIQCVANYSKVLRVSESTNDIIGY